ncbi:50S ribosomal protein L16 [Patescibacteria group bacterium]
MLQPKKSKYRKQFRGKMRGVRTRGSALAFGDYGLKSLGRGWLDARQIEAARRAITHITKRAGKVWIRVFPDKPVTAKASGAKMGSGKGEIKSYVVVIRPGRIIFELSGVEKELAQKAMKLAAAKLPFKSRFTTREK